MTRFFALAVGVCTAWLVTAANEAARADEAAAVKAVIEAETAAFYKRDADGWKDTWSHAADVTRTIASSSNYNALVGWENFGPAIVDFLGQAEAVSVKVKNDNYIVKLSESLAWVEYDQTMDVVGVEPARQRHSREHRALQKIDGKWKIIAQITHDVPWDVE